MTATASETSEAAVKRAPWWHRVAGHVTRALLAFVRVVPAPLSYGIADIASLLVVAWVATTHVLRGRRPRSTGFYRNYGIVYRDAATPRHRRRMMRAWARHICHLMVDFCRMPKITADNYLDYVDVADYAQMREAMKMSGGLIGATGHIGFFELGGYLAPLEGVPTAAIFNDSPIETVTDVVNGIRSRNGMVVLKREGATRAMLKAVKGGTNVGFAVDIGTKRNPVFAPFLGTMAATNKTAALLHLKTGIPIQVWTVSRTARMRYKFHVWDTIYHERSGDQDADAAAIMARVNAALSRAVLARPEQWFWQSRRYRYRPPGEQPLPGGLPPLADPSQLPPEARERATSES